MFASILSTVFIFAVQDDSSIDIYRDPEVGWVNKNPYEWKLKEQSWYRRWAERQGTHLTNLKTVALFSDVLDSPLSKVADQLVTTRFRKLGIRVVHVADPASLKSVKYPMITPRIIDGGNHLWQIDFKMEEIVFLPRCKQNLLVCSWSAWKSDVNSEYRCEDNDQALKVFEFKLDEFSSEYVEANKLAAKKKPKKN